MAGSLNLFDGVDLTADSESSPRTRAINTLQIHHGTVTDFEFLKSLMDPGGRQVSANGAMSNTGHLDEVVRLDRRAFTSSSSFDNQCLTVEVCNTTLGPSWGISEASRVRLARLAVAMYRAGILGSLTRAHIIGHYEVPGTYPTACPGPDMALDHIVMLANLFYNAGEGPASKEIKVKSLSYIDRRVRTVAPGESIVLQNTTGADQDVTGGYVGAFTFTPHIYADGQPGDVVELRLEWRNRKTYGANPVASPHYVERVTIDEQGMVRASRTFARKAKAEDAVVLRMLAPASNAAPVTVSVLDIDAMQYAVA